MSVHKKLPGFPQAVENLGRGKGRTFPAASQWGSPRALPGEALRGAGLNSRWASHPRSPLVPRIFSYAGSSKKPAPVYPGQALNGTESRRISCRRKILYSIGGARGGKARLESNRMPRKALLHKACGPRSGDFPAAEQRESIGMIFPGNGKIPLSG